jgi:hypothetical protein
MYLKFWQNYDYAIIYFLDRENIIAQALSRKIHSVDINSEIINFQNLQLTTTIRHNRKLY